MPLCPRCQTPSPPDARFCPTCGTQVTPAPPRDAPTCARHPEREALRPCPRCGTFACAACLAPGADGVELCEGCRSRVHELPLPWDRRPELGLWRAWSRTVWSLLISPIRTLGPARPSGSLGSSLLFATICQLASILPTALLYGAFIGVVGTILDKGDKSHVTPGLAAGIGGGVTVLFILLAILMGVAALFINAGLDHLVLRLSGAHPRGFETTVRAAALSFAPAICGLVPICGLYIYPVWMVILRVLAYRAFHQTTAGKAALAAILAPAVAFILFIAAYTLLFVSAMSSISSAQ